MASNARFQSMLDVRFLTYASTKTTSALLPPCVHPLQRDMWQSGSQPSCLYMSSRDDSICICALGSMMLNNGWMTQNESQMLGSKLSVIEAHVGGRGTHQ